MIIKAEYKGKPIEIEVPNSEYWIKRNKQRKSQYWSDADNLDKRIGKEFAKAYKELEKELYTFIGKYGTDGVLKFSNARIIELMKEIKPYIDNLYEFQQTTITELLTDCYSNNYLQTLYEFSVGLNIATSFVGINETAIKTALSFPWSGENFSERIYSNKNKLIATLRQELTQSIIRGDSIQKTSRVVKDRLDINNKNASRLVQTEMASVLTDSSLKTYKDFGVDEYEYIATLDDRTSEICKELDGKVIKITDAIRGVNIPPMHPRCRSDFAPYFSEYVGERIAKRLNTGEYEYVRGDMSYKEWEKRFVK